MNLDEIRAWTANQLRTRHEYRSMPIITGSNIHGPCFTCAKTTRHRSGYCDECRKDRP